MKARLESINGIMYEAEMISELRRKKEDDDRLLYK